VNPSLKKQDAMMKQAYLAVVVAATLCSACAELAGPQTPRALAVNGHGRLEVYNAGVDRAVPATPCLTDARHRQFDFWVGSWQMGGQRSIVRSLLDGCMIEENYMPGTPPSAPGQPPGPPAVLGRSINAYDPDTGLWHQTWISVFPTGHIRMSGRLQDGVMRLGLQVQTPTGPFTINYWWTRQGETDVLQSWNINGRENSLLYKPLSGFELAAPAPFPFCQPGTPRPGGDQNRKIDFLLGEWSVQGAEGPVLGTARVTSDLNGCLAREDYSTDKGYAAHSYLYFDLNTQKWHRTYIDSEGERVELFGNFVTGALVLQGAEPGPGGKTWHVRNTIQPVAASAVLQTWETSEDGVNWVNDLKLTFNRK
jgi:hypothetical protein